MQTTITKTENFVEKPTTLKFSEQSITETIEFLSDNDDDDERRNRFGGKSAIIQVLKVNQKARIDSRMLEDFVQNFNDGIPRPEKEIFIDFGHNVSGVAAGWVTQLFLSDDRQRLFGFIDFTPSGTRAVSGGEFRFFSPEIARVHKPFDGKSANNVLVGGALTNIPTFQLREIKIGEESRTEKFSSKEYEQMETEKFAQVIEENSKLKGQNESLTEKYSQAEQQIADFKAKESETEKKLSAVTEKFSQAEAKLQEAAKERETEKFSQTFEKLITEKKVTPAQREFFTANFNSEKLEEFGKTAPELFAEAVGSNAVTTEKYSAEAKNLAGLKIVGHEEKALQEASEFVEAHKR